MPNIKEVGRVSGAGVSAAVAPDLSATEMKLLREMFASEVGKQPVMAAPRAAKSAKAARSARPSRPPIVAKYLKPPFGPVLRYLKPIIDGESDYNVVVALVNRVVDNKKVSEKEARVIKKVFNRVLTDNPQLKPKIQKYLDEALRTSGVTIKDKDATRILYFAKDAPLADYLALPGGSGWGHGDVNKKRLDDANLRGGTGKKIGEGAGNLKGREGWWQARHGGRH